MMVGLGASALQAVAGDRFALTIGAHDNLIINGAGQERVVVTVPTISQTVTIGSTSFQVSFGRDANDVLTAIIAPDASQPQDLHFDVLRKSVDSTKQAVVTLTFPSSERVIVDPGYTGTVAVNSKSVKHRDVAETAPIPAPRKVAAPAAPRVAVAKPVPAPAPAPKKVVAVEAPPAPVVKTPVVAKAPAPEPVSKSVVVVKTSDPKESASLPDKPTAETPEPTASSPDANVSTSTPMAITPPPLLGSWAAQPVAASAPQPPENSEKLYWSEPITPPEGSGPTAASNEMKVVEVQGPVSIKYSNGDTKKAKEGMIIPSGATVVTAGDSSAAVFIGGVNSVRLLPSSEAKVNQNVDGTVRHTTVNLVQGTVFSRVGRRAGETQDYQVKTPEGVAAARGTQYCSYRGKGADGKTHHYTFVASGVVECFVAGLTYKVVAGSSSDVGSAVMPPSNDAKAILHAILIQLQPFNLKLASVLTRLQNGTATENDKAFYHSIVDVFFGEALPTVLRQYQGSATGLQNVVPAARRALNQILEPFGTVPLTPF